MSYLIAGAPCSGKTSIIRELNKKGYSVLYEAAREVIEREKKKNPEFSTHKTPLEAQTLIFKEQLQREQKARKVVFIESGITSLLAYLKIHGIEIPEFMTNEFKKTRYEKVFLLEPSNKKFADGIRDEDLMLIETIDKELSKLHKDMGYYLIKVPYIPVKDRVEFILKQI